MTANASTLGLNRFIENSNRHVFSISIPRSNIILFRFTKKILANPLAKIMFTVFGKHLIEVEA